MSPEMQDKVFKMVGALLVAGVGIACVKLIPNDPGMIVTIMGTVSTAYGGVAYNSPLKPVRKAKGLVSVRTPAPDEEAAMRATIKKIDTEPPPPAQPGGQS